jgi:hypothetical protein
MKEQIQVPFDNKSEDQEKGSSPKELSKPLVPFGLDKVKKPDLLKDRVKYMNCNGCSLPKCKQPEHDENFHWVYYSASGEEVDTMGDPDFPANGRRFLPGKEKKT